MISAAQWFAISGLLMFLFGLGLLALAISNLRRRRRPPVRVISKARIHEVTMLPGSALGLGIEVVEAYPLRYPPARLDATRLDLRRGPRGVRA